MRHLYGVAAGRVLGGGQVGCLGFNAHVADDDFVGIVTDLAGDGPVLAEGVDMDPCAFVQEGSWGSGAFARLGGFLFRLATSGLMFPRSLRRLLMELRYLLAELLRGFGLARLGLHAGDDLAGLVLGLPYDPERLGEPFAGRLRLACRQLGQLLLIFLGKLSQPLLFALGISPLAVVAAFALPHLRHRPLEGDLIFVECRTGLGD